MALSQRPNLAISSGLPCGLCSASSAVPAVMAAFLYETYFNLRLFWLCFKLCRASPRPTICRLHSVGVFEPRHCACCFYVLALCSVVVRLHTASLNLDCMLGVPAHILVCAKVRPTAVLLPVRLVNGLRCVSFSAVALRRANSALKSPAHGTGIYQAWNAFPVSPSPSIWAGCLKLRPNVHRNCVVRIKLTA